MSLNPKVLVLSRRRVRNAVFLQIMECLILAPGHADASANCICTVQAHFLVRAPKAFSTDHAVQKQK